MLIVKYISIFAIFVISMLISRQLAKRYKDREEELEEMKIALNMFKTKLKFTYDPIPEIFREIQFKIKNIRVKKIFETAIQKMEEQTAEKSWENAVDLNMDNLNKEDKYIIKTLSKLLGQTDVEGQVGRIEITEELLEKQIEDARCEKRKNEKLYGQLGGIIGLAVVIILI